MTSIENYFENPYIAKCLEVLIIVAVCVILNLFLCLVFKKITKKKDAIHLKFFKSLTHVIIFAVCIYQILTLFSFTKDISKTLMQSSALLLAVATFAAQHALGNIISGFFLSASKPYELNDKIKVLSGGTVLAEGLVADITIRHTIIKTYDGQSCIIPNSTMDASVIVNSNYTKDVGNFLEVEIGYDSDVEMATKIFKDIVINHPLTLNKDTNTSVLLKEIASSGLILKATIWSRTVDDNFLACSDIRKSILKAFKENNIEIPYNIVTIKTDQSAK